MSSTPTLKVDGFRVELLAWIDVLLTIGHRLGLLDTQSRLLLNSPPHSSAI